MLHHNKSSELVVGLPAGSVILETELEQALTVEADAFPHLGVETDGQWVQFVLAVMVRGRLRSASQLYLYQRFAGAT